MPEDKSLFYYGSIYHRLFDPPLAEVRQAAVDLIPAGSSVVDIACGTGQLCRELRDKKNCRVVGLDLSRRMLEFTRNSTRDPEVTFLHEDGPVSEPVVRLRDDASHHARAYLHPAAARA